MRISWSKYWWPLACVALLIGCGGGPKSNGTPSELPRAASATTPTLVIGADTTFPPMQFIDDAGAIVGFDAELVRTAAREAGFEPEIRSVAWDGIFGALQAGQVRLIASSITITPQRQAQFAFTRPYYQAGQVILVRTEDKRKWGDTLESLNGKRVGVQISTTGAELMSTRSVTLKQYNSPALALMDMINGNLDAVVVDKPVADYYAAKKAEFRTKVVVASQPQTTEAFGWVTRKDDVELVTKLNQALERLEQNGTVARLKDQWFR